MRYLLYSHDGLGLGHVRRNLAIAAALGAVEPDCSVLLATGIQEVEALGVPARADVLRLPALRKMANDAYEARRLPVSPAEIRDLRSNVLRAAIEAYRPDVVLTDKHPLGVCAELRPALDVLRAAGGRAALGVRDILDRADSVRAAWDAADATRVIGQYYDAVLVYGQPEIFDPVAVYGWQPSVAERTAFCGYVTEPRPPEPPVVSRRDGARPVVLATVGGGADGLPYLSAFVSAASAAAWDAVVVAGPQASEDDVATIRRRAEQVGVHCHVFVPALADWFSSVDALVCMGGYNTLAEAMATSTPTVCVPRAEPRAEQLLRARAFARLGLLRMVEPTDLSVDVLRTTIEGALGTRRADVAERVNATLRLDGARRAAEALVELAHRPCGAPHETASLHAL